MVASLHILLSCIEVLWFEYFRCGLSSFDIPLLFLLLFTALLTVCWGFTRMILIDFSWFTFPFFLGRVLLLQFSAGSSTAPLLPYSFIIWLVLLFFSWVDCFHWWWSIFALLFPVIIDWIVVSVCSIFHFLCDIFQTLPLWSEYLSLLPSAYFPIQSLYSPKLSLFHLILCCCFPSLW